MLIIVLLILIAVGVLLLSEPGQALLGMIIAALGVLLVIGFWLALLAIAVTVLLFIAAAVGAFA